MPPRYGKTRPKKGAHCYWCKRALEPSWSRSQTAFTRDHIVPQSAGGKKWVPCCRACNHMKSNMLPDAWLYFMSRYPEWWVHYPKQATTLLGM